MEPSIVGSFSISFGHISITQIVLRSSDDVQYPQNPDMGGAKVPESGFASLIIPAFRVG